MKIIDPHLHLFDLKKGQYHWLKPESEPKWPDKHVIRKDFSEQDLFVDHVGLQNKRLDLCGFVHIEAGFDNEKPWREVDWLEKAVVNNFKTIASTNLLLAPDMFKKQIEELKRYSSVVGVRHILDDNAKVILSSDNCLDNLSFLESQGLIFELQANIADPLIVDSIIESLSALSYGNLTVVINHAGFPPLEPNLSQYELANWLSGIEQLSAFSNVLIKCSGWEMSNRNYTAASIESQIKSVINAFGVQRVMMASNFPLCTFTMSYSDYWKNIILVLHNLNISSCDQKALLHDNAYANYFASVKNQHLSLNL